MAAPPKKPEEIMPLKGFLGKNVRRDIDEAYDGAIYQYAWSSYRDPNNPEKDLIRPKAVIYPTDDSDVFRAIDYATFHKVGIAIRTGGHSYCGSSSTNGENIQLDLSKTYTDFNWDNDDHTQVTLGISITLSRLQSKLRQKKRFLPTGQCSYVNLGGHVQTGGYGQLCRSFGLLADYVQKIRIITANPPEARWVDRNNAEDKELFRAILGGSPGNFGVVTDVTLKVLKDEDHPLSRGFRCLFEYKEETLKKLLDVLVKQDENDDTPGDFDCIISLISKREEEEDREAAVIVVYAQWANLKGAGQRYDPKFFNDLREAGGGEKLMAPFHGVLLNDEQMDMSEMCSHWVFNMAREYQLPYFKRLYLSNSRYSDLKNSNWTAWVASQVAKLEGKGGMRDEWSEEEKKKQEEKLNNGLHVAGQFQYCGGFQSRLRIKDRDNLTSLSWRDSSFGCTLDAFYDYPGNLSDRKKLRANPESQKSIAALDSVRKAAKAWVVENDLESVTHCKFTKEDRRLMWGSHDQDLEEAKGFYYGTDKNSVSKYKKLRDLKQQLDPNSVFTANRFSIGPHPDRLKIGQQKVGNKADTSNAAVYGVEE